MSHFDMPFRRPRPQDLSSGARARRKRAPESEFGPNWGVIVLTLIIVAAIFGTVGIIGRAAGAW